MKPRILFIVNSLCFGGAEKHLVTLLNHLDHTRFHTALAYLKDVAEIRTQLMEERVAGGVFCLHAAKKLDLGVIDRLADYIRRERIDIIVCVNNYPLWYGYLARRKAGSKAKLLELLHTTELGPFKYHLNMWLTRPFYAACNLIIYVCENQRQFWRKRFLSRKHDVVIHNGIDVAHFADHYSPFDKQQVREQYGVREGDFVIGLCAALRPEKAHGDLLQAAARLRAQGVGQLRLWFIGDGVERARIETQIASLGLQQIVTITGFFKDVRPVIAACDAMALTSHRETFSLAALEAMALGKPMIMTETGGAGEQVVPGENGYLYPVGDIDALCQVIQSTMQPGNSQAMGNKARETVVQSFSQQVMIDQYQALFAGLAKGAHHGR